MAITQVPDTDNFEQWRIKTNDIANQVGDLANLETQTTTDIVSAINSAQGLSIAMSIALG
jgi:hypothetical protein